MKPDLYALLKVLVIIVCTAGAGYAQSADTIKADSSKPHYETTLSYPRIDRHFKYQINGRNLRTIEILDHLSCVDSTILRQYKQGRKVQRIGVGIIAAGTLVLAAGEFVFLGNVLISGLYGNNRDDDRSTGVLLMVSGGGLMVAGLVQCILGRNVKRKAIDTYNMRVKRKDITLYVKPGLTGLSIGLRF